jgi:anti-sigma B factor antagonist
MEMEISEHGAAAAKIALRGRLDAMGVEDIETRFTSTAATGKHALVDLSGVTAITSMGIRLLISTARAMRHRNTKMVLFGAQPFVNETLDHISLHHIIPVLTSEDEALVLVRA